MTSELFGPICSVEKYLQGLTDSLVRVGVVPADHFNLNSREAPLLIFLSGKVNFEKILYELKSIICKGEHIRNALTSRGFELLTDRAKFIFQDSTDQYDPIALVSYGFPFVAKKIFSCGYEKYFAESLGDLPKELIKCMSGCGYPIELLTSELIKKHTPGYVHQLLHLNFIFNERKIDYSESKIKTGVVFFVYFDSLVPLCVSYIKKISKLCNVFLVSPKPDLLDKYRRCLNSLTSVEYRLQQNRGRNEAAYFVTCRDVIEKFDLVCLVHDKKASHFNNSLISQSTFKHCFDNTLGSEALISKIIRTFAENPYLGMLCPPLPIHSKWRKLLEDPYGVNKKIMRDLKRKMKLQEEFDDFVVAPFGGVFWIRTKAIKTLMAQNLSYKDFPPEPLREDGTLLHALERIYPEIIKQNGFACGFVMSSKYAETYMDNIIFNLRSYQNIIKKDRDLSFIDFLKAKIKKNSKFYLFCYSVKYNFERFLKQK